MIAQPDDWLPLWVLPLVGAFSLACFTGGQHTKRQFCGFAGFTPRKYFWGIHYGRRQGEGKKRKTAPIESFQDWVLSYTEWASTIVVAALSRGLELLQYLGFISHLARDNPSFVWLHYDKQLWQMAAAVPQSTKWDELHFQFLQWTKQKENSSSSSRDPCKRWKEGRIASFPLARGTMFALSVVGLIELYPARPLELHLILLPMAPGVLVLGRCLCLLPPLLPHAEAYL